MFIRDQVSRGLKRWHALAHQHHAEDDRGNADDQQQITDTMPTVPLPVVCTTSGEGGIRGHGALLQAELPVQSCTLWPGAIAHHEHITDGLTELPRR
jgi:hypothetical protein